MRKDEKANKNKKKKQEKEGRNLKIIREIKSFSPKPPLHPFETREPSHVHPLAPFDL